MNVAQLGAMAGLGGRQTADLPTSSDPVDALPGRDLGTDRMDKDIAPKASAPRFVHTATHVEPATAVGLQPGDTTTLVSRARLWLSHAAFAVLIGATVTAGICAAGFVPLALASSLASVVPSLAVGCMTAAIIMVMMSVVAALTPNHPPGLPEALRAHLLAADLQATDHG